MNETLKKILKVLFPRMIKEPENPGVIGHYDSKPYHNFRYALVYANEEEIFNNEKVEVYSRNYKITTFVNVLVNDEEGFVARDYSYEKLEPLLAEKGIEKKNKNIVLISFQHCNEYTISQAKTFCNSTKNNFEHAMIYNPVKVQMDFYKPVPKFYRLYDHFCEAIYFDLAFIDDKRE